MNVHEDTYEEFEPYIGDISSDDLELVKLVRLNPGLWNNSLKIYSKAEDKTLAWSLLGQNLSTPLSGSDAQKKFTSWRSTFGRIHKKVLRSQPKSGSAGDQSVHIPVWPLYNELLFLKDVIKPRLTKSNFVNSPCVKEIKENILSIPKKLPTIQLDKPVCVSILKKPRNPLKENTAISEQFSNYTLLELNESAISNVEKIDDVDKIDNVEEVDNSSSVLNSKYFVEHSSNNSFCDSQTDVSDAGSVMSEMLKSNELQSQKKLKTPPPDRFFNKRKAKDDEDLKVLKDMADSVRIMTTTLTTNTSSKPDINQDSCKEILHPEIEAFVQVLKCSLERIPPTSRLTCLIELLSIIQKYEQA